MLNIKDVEQITGIPKQTIRYYERQGLICPNRNEENDYREYSEEDVKSLKMIKLFRKLDIPVEEVKRILGNEITLQEALSVQKERLAPEKKKLDDALNFCDKIKAGSLEELDVNVYLNKMEEEERHGAKFADWLSDFRKVAQAESKREFSFVPDTMCKTAREFSDALFKYAEENNLNLVITKECMYPEFTIDGIEYVADRTFWRYGAVIHCEAVHLADVIPPDISREDYKKLKRIMCWFFGITTGICLLLFNMQSRECLIAGIAMAVIEMVGFVATYGRLRNLQN